MENLKICYENEFSFLDKSSIFFREFYKSSEGVGGWVVLARVPHPESKRMLNLAVFPFRKRKWPYLDTIGELEALDWTNRNVSARSSFLAGS